ncbi:hypothetical protein [Wolbachia endosymbiont (group A) of Lasioglossum fulvicorne]
MKRAIYAAGTQPPYHRLSLSYHIRTSMKRAIIASNTLGLVSMGFAL